MTTKPRKPPTPPTATPPMSAPPRRPTQRATPAATHQPPRAGAAGPALDAAGAAPADMNWYESSYELMRGVDVIESEWPEWPGLDAPAA